MRQQPSTTASPVTFLVEHYWPMVDEALLRASLPRLEMAVGAMRSAGHRIDHLGFLLVPTDQVAFSVIRASSEAIAREAYSRAHVRVDRIAAVTPVGFDLRDAPRAEKDPLTRGIRHGIDIEPPAKLTATTSTTRPRQT
jgi:hypothetical protein